MTLACDGQFFPVHKLVLSVCSEYFEEILRQTTCSKPVIVLKDIRHNDLQALLNYMYAGEANVPQSDLARLIKAAESLRIKGLAVPDESPPGRDKKRPATDANKLVDVNYKVAAKRRKSDLVNSVHCHSITLDSDDDNNGVVDDESDLRRISSTAGSVVVQHGRTTTVNAIHDSSSITSSSPSQPILVHHQYIPPQHQMHQQQHQSIQLQHLEQHQLMHQENNLTGHLSGNQGQHHSALHHQGMTSEDDTSSVQGDVLASHSIPEVRITENLTA